MRTLFVTGTDTGVGKTHVATLLLRELAQWGYRTGAYKPACSGAIINDDTASRWDDIDRLTEAHNMNRADLICPQRFLAPLAPPLAARQEGRAVDLSAINSGLLAWRDCCDTLVVEGAGGWLCPLTETVSFADWVAGWRMPVLIVARRGLGTINHTLLTIAAIRARRLPVAGVVLNQATAFDDDPSISWNAAEIEARSGVPVLGEIRLNGSELRQDDRTVRMNWWNLMSELGDDRVPFVPSC